MSPQLEEIVRKLGNLPEAKLQDVLEFIDFLAWQHRQHFEKDIIFDAISDSLDEPLLKIAGTLSGEPISGQSIEDEIY